MEKTEKLLLRVVDAAEMIGVLRSKMYELIASGAVPCVRLEGRILRVPVSALRSLADAGVADSLRIQNGGAASERSGIH